MKISKLPLFLAPLLLFGCSNADPENKIAELSELQKQWTLTSVDGTAVDKKITSTLHIDSRNKATGSLACNNFFGDFQLKESESKAIINKLGATKRLCDEATNKMEHIVSMTLSTWSNIQVSETQLVITDENHSLKYIFKL
jgi:heat shock protein HslJ